MKKTLILMSMCLFVMAASAKPVTQKEAACVANRFWQTVLHGEGQVHPCPWQYSQVYLFVVTRFIANTPFLVGFGYPVGWMCCCAIEVTYYFVRWGRKGSVPQGSNP